MQRLDTEKLKPGSDLEKSAKEYLALGDNYRINNKHQLAISAYNKVIELEPNNVEAYNNRGDVYRALENVKLAIDDFNSRK